MKKELHNAWEYLESLGYKPHYLAVYGSQNYGLEINTDEYKSDIDFKCIIIPTLEDLVKNSKPVSTVVEYNGGQIDIKDIRSYVDSVVKCNVNFLEILSTPYYICEDEFLRPYFKPLMEEMGSLYLKACYGMMLEKKEALRHPYPSIAHKIEKFGYDPKQLHHIERLLNLMMKYIEGDIGTFDHELDIQKMLINIKIGKLPNDIVDSVANVAMDIAKNIRDSYTKEPVFTTKNTIINTSQAIIYNKIKNSCQH